MTSGVPKRERDRGRAPPGLFLYVWQIKDLKSFVFVSVARKGLTDAFFGCVASKGLSLEKCPAEGGSKGRAGGRRGRLAVNTRYSSMLVTLSQAKSPIFCGKVVANHDVRALDFLDHLIPRTAKARPLSAL